jgi:mono/diheme cytochrome c family protein
MMRRIALVPLIACLIAAVPEAVPAQQASQKLDATEALGQRLYMQHCGVCHTKPTISSPYYGPPLSKEQINNNEDALREFVQIGTDRMPGFQYTLDARQVDSIIRYLKTVSPPPPDAPASRPAARGNERELD